MRVINVLTAILAGSAVLAVLGALLGVITTSLLLLCISLGFAFFSAIGFISMAIFGKYWK